ncbi:MAG: hypothetical protein LBI15_11520 [Dysgonamonadaceae bacterium]|jgi:hypothetical protein|nr:hypothetical protein [Dysgonamonadaceae bacterium]
MVKEKFDHIHAFNNEYARVILNDKQNLSTNRANWIFAVIITGISLMNIWDDNFR